MTKIVDVTIQTSKWYPYARRSYGFILSESRSLRKTLRRYFGPYPGEQCRTHNLLQVPIAELAERWTELPQVSDESRSFFRVHTGYFSNIPKCIKAEFIASWGCSQSSVVSSSQR
ncbi:hypothetical protein TNCV_593611 [Trichonephila clavipes]|nr:hypothetical protein TNCV_593611 [Trichonephila clavipes]